MHKLIQYIAAQSNAWHDALGFLGLVYAIAVIPIAHFIFIAMRDRSRRMSWMPHALAAFLTTALLVVAALPFAAAWFTNHQSKARGSVPVAAATGVFVLTLLLKDHKKDRAGLK